MKMNDNAHLGPKWVQMAILLWAGFVIGRAISDLAAKFSF